MTFHLMCVHIIFSSVLGCFGKELLTRFGVCSLCILTICSFSYFQFWFRGLDLGSNFFQFLVFAYLFILIHLFFST